MFILKPVDIVRDPIHKYIEWTDIEEAIIDSPWLQRLRNIKQTPSVSFVYPGATHNRFEHSIGVMHLAGMWIEHLLKNKYINGEKKQRDLIKKQVQKVRIAGLLHDIGTSPFSHIFEYYFLFKLGQKRLNHENLGIKIIDEVYKPLLTTNNQWDEIRLDEKDIEDIKAMIKGDVQDTENLFLYQIVANKRSVDVDKIDWLLRDSHYSGAVEYGGIDAERLISNSEIGPGNEIVYHTRIYYAYQHFWLARIHMYRNLYHHRTSIAFNIFFGEFFKAVEENKKLINQIEESLSYYFNLTDSTFSEIYRNEDKIAPFIERLSKRDIPRMVYERERTAEFRIIARALDERKDEIESEMKKYLQREGFTSQIINGLHFEASYINLPKPPKNIWIGPEGKILEEEPYSFMDILAPLLVIFLRVYSWDDIEESEKQRLSGNIDNFLSSWMEKEGLTKEAGETMGGLNL